MVGNELFFYNTKAESIEMFYILFHINENGPNLQKYYALQREWPWEVSKRGPWKSKKNRLKYCLEINFKIGIVFYEMGISFFTRIRRYLYK